MLNQEYRWIVKLYNQYTCPLKNKLLTWFINMNKNIFWYDVHINILISLMRTKDKISYCKKFQDQPAVSIYTLIQNPISFNKCRIFYTLFEKIYIFQQNWNKKFSYLKCYRASIIQSLIIETPYNFLFLIYLIYI